MNSRTRWRPAITWMAILFTVGTVGCSRETENAKSDAAADAAKFTPRQDAAATDLLAIDGAATKSKGDVIQLVDLSEVSSADIPIAVAAVVSLRGVEEVRLKGSAVGDPAVLPIAGLRSLKRLRLTDTSVTDLALQKLADRGELQLLHVQTAGEVTSAGFQNLGRLTELRELSLAGPNVDDSVISAIAKLPNLKKLRLRGTAIKGTDFDAISKSSVEDLELAETEFSNAGMSAVAKMPKLTKLNLWLTKVDDDGLQRLARQTQLTSLNLDNMPGITDASMDLVAGLKNLTFLHLGKTKVTADGLMKLTALKNLTTLHITNLGISEEVVETLRREMPALEELVN